MSVLDKYKAKPLAIFTDDPQGRYEKYNLKDNPFPSFPSVNQESNDPRLNGDIYDDTIRKEEFVRMKQNFLTVPQSNLNHLRLGYIVDTSYIGRGNGKSSFLIYLQKEINRDFCLSISGGLNKCFALILQPEPRGQTKTFDNFTDVFAESMFKSDVLGDALATLRLQAILVLYPDFDISSHFADEIDLRTKLNSEGWYIQNPQINLHKVNKHILSNSYLQSLPADFPLYQDFRLFDQVVSPKSFAEYYHSLKRGKPKIEFVFSHLVNLFLAADFNGAYLFVDDFERIPDFQSDRQKRDFALSLRTCLFDGLYTSAKIGFYNFFFALHAGVPRAIQKAWDESGLERRAPVFYKSIPNHVIQFDKITDEHAFLLVETYLKRYRINPDEPNTIKPFKRDAILKIASLSQFNAAEILKKSYETLERASDENISQIDAGFVQAGDESTLPEQKQSEGIHERETINPIQKARSG